MPDYSDKFIKAVNHLLTEEGGHCDTPGDHGGETNFGITKASYPDLDIKALPRDEAIAIYFRDFWTPNNYEQIPDDEIAELRAHVAREIGSFARPEDVRFAAGLPKTRSGKIMRRLLRELATNGQVKGETTTLEDLNVIAALQAGDEE